MAKVEVDVLLKDGTDETAFINDVTSNTEVDLKNRLPSSPTLVILNVEESYLNTLRSHSSVVSAEIELPAFAPVTYPDRPSKVVIADKSIGGTTYWTNWDGRKCLSFQHYLDTDIIPEPSPDRTVPGQTHTGHNVGNHYYYGASTGKRDQVRHYGSQPASDHGTYGNDNDYWSYYTGKNVDIIIQDSGILQYHPEFMKDGKSRVKDVILDGPIYIDPDSTYLNNNKYTKTDGRIGITTTAANMWWENNSTTYRSARFASGGADDFGTISIASQYTCLLYTSPSPRDS